MKGLKKNSQAQKDEMDEANSKWAQSILDSVAKSDRLYFRAAQWGIGRIG
jgi:hypothetical protein